MSLSVCIITLNEEENLPRCLDSVADLADQVVVVDSLSTDGTRALAAARGAEVVERAFTGHVDQKQFALERATGDWVLCLDADEWLDDELRAAVRAVISGPGSGPVSGPVSDPVGGPADNPVGYEVDRRVHYLGKVIEHGGWSPQWRLRLVARGRARWTGVDPHDRLEADGPVARLPGHLDHVPYRDLSEHMAKLDGYTDIMVARRREAGERASLPKLLLRPPARFLRMYLLRAGFRDGWRGLVLAGFAAFYVFLKYAKLLAAERAAAGARGD